MAERALRDCLTWDNVPASAAITHSSIHYTNLSLSRVFCVSVSVFYLHCEIGNGFVSKQDTTHSEKLHLFVIYDTQKHRTVNLVWLHARIFCD